MQNFGLRDGVPGTAYNKAVQAVQQIEEILYPIVLEVLEDEEALMKSNTVLGNLVKSMKEEGTDIMSRGDVQEKARHFSVEVITLTFAGTN